jgi:hypothetical protein
MSSHNIQVSPIVSSGFGIGAGEAILNSISGELGIIHSLQGNIVTLAIFLIGCYALALGVGQHLISRGNNENMSALASFSTSTISQGILPPFLGAFMLSNAPIGSTVESVTGNFLGFIAFLGIVFLGVGMFLITRPSGKTRRR